MRFSMNSYLLGVGTVVGALAFGFGGGILLTKTAIKDSPPGRAGSNASRARNRRLRTVQVTEAGRSRCRVPIRRRQFNPNRPRKFRRRGAQSCFRSKTCRGSGEAGAGKGR